MRCQPKSNAMCRSRFGKKLDMSSGTAGNTLTGDRAVASNQTSREAVAVAAGLLPERIDSLRSPFGRTSCVCPRERLGANRRTFVLYRLVAPLPWLKYRNRTGDTTISCRMLYPLS